MAIQYAPSISRVNTTTTCNTKADLCSMLDTALVTGAGWARTTTTSSTDHVYQSQATPQGNQMQIRIWDGGANCVRFRLMNNAQTISQSDSCYFFVTTSTTVKVIANAYQFCVFVPGSVSTRNFIMCSALYIPPFLVTMGLTTALMIQGDGGSDTDTSNARGSWRTVLNARGVSGNAPAQGWTLLNSTAVEYNGLTSDSSVHQGLLGFMLAQSTCVDSISGYRWHDDSAFIMEPLVGWGTTTVNDEFKIRGQLWDALLTTEAYAGDTTTTVTLDSNNWYCVTNNNNGSVVLPSTMRGSLFLVAN